MPLPELVSEIMKITIKSATNKSVSGLSEILTQALKEKLKHNDDAWGVEPFTPEEIQQSVDDKSRYLICLHDKIIGTFILTWEDKRIWGSQPANAAYLHQLAIGDSYRGLGVGHCVLEKISQLTKEKSKNYIRIDFPSSNEGLRKYYEKLDFQLVANKEIKMGSKVYSASLYELTI